MMTHEEKANVLAKVQKILETKELSQAQLSRMTGISESILSSLRKGDYKGDTERYITLLAGYFQRKEAARGLTSDDLPYVSTSLSDRVYSVISNCHIRGGFSAVAGDSGIGKTRAALQYCEDNPDRAIYLCLNPCVASLKATLRLLARELGVTGQSADELWFGILDRLADGTVIILDEAQHLTFRTYETFRSFLDYFVKVKRTLGIALVGSREVVERFDDGRQRSSKFAQIINRTRPREVYQVKHVRREDIRLLFPDVKEAGAISFLLKVVQNEIEGIRGAVGLYCDAADNGNTTENGLRAMAEKLRIRV